MLIIGDFTLAEERVNALYERARFLQREAEKKSKNLLPWDVSSIAAARKRLYSSDCTPEYLSEIEQGNGMCLCVCVCVFCLILTVPDSQPIAPLAQPVSAAMFGTIHSSVLL